MSDIDVTEAMQAGGNTIAHMRFVCQNCPQYSHSRTTARVYKAGAATSIDPWV